MHSQLVSSAPTHATRPDADVDAESTVVRYVVMRCYLSSAPWVRPDYNRFVDVSVTEGSSEYTVFAAAVRRLVETSFPDRPHPDHWRLDSIERRPQ